MHHRIPYLLAALLYLGGTACGQWVRYGEDGPAQGTDHIEDLVEATRLNHQALAGPVSLYANTTGDGSQVLVDYDAWAADPEARYLLERYLAIVGSVNPSNLADEDERLAYWINGYNANVIQAVLGDYDGDPTFQVINGLFFDTPRATFGGLLLTLNQVENGVIRGDFQAESVQSAAPDVQEQLHTWHDELWGGGAVDPRIHAALNCAALSCPNLLSSAPFVYRADQIQDQLDTAARRWMNDPTKGAGRNGISSLFDWYRADFVAAWGSVDDFIEHFRDDGLTDVDLDAYLPYDWSLNIAR